MDERLSRRFDLSSHMCFMARNLNGMLPTYTQAGVYTEVAHYLKSDPGAGSDDADKVVAELREMKINDFMTKDGRLREHVASCATCISKR